MRSRVHKEAEPGSHRCMLDIIHVHPVAVVPEVAVQWGPVAYESYIELHTGRTHQVREGNIRHEAISRIAAPADGCTLHLYVASAQ